MNKIIKHLATGLLVMFTLQSTVFATEITVPKKDGEIHTHKLKPALHYGHAASRILENKYGITSADIEKAKKEGKTFFDLAKSKGVSEADFRNAIISPKLKAIDASIATGELTKEKAAEFKSKIKESIISWDGKIVDSKDRHTLKEDEKDAKENSESTENKSSENTNEQAS
jgi:hypothetical protein